MLKGILTDIAREETSNYLDTIDFYTKMNSIGSFGKIIFKVSSLETLSPNDYEVTIASKVKKHSLINSPDITEYQGRELITVSFGIKLLYSLTNVSEAIGKLNKYCNEGHHFPLVLGGKKIGDHNFIIKSFSRKITKTDKIGTPLVIDCNISLEEYIEEITKKPQLQIQQKGTKMLERKTVAMVNSVITKELEKVRLW